MDSFTWRAQPFSWELAERYAQELRLPLLAAIVLAGRGFGSVEEARAFLDIDESVPDPFLFAGMPEAAYRLSLAIDNGERVVVHGDYDVDGISATALLVRGLASFGLTAETYLPSRFGHGYGLSRGGLQEVAQGGPGLLVTVDCGVAYPEEVAYAQDLGLEVVVTDHHEPGEKLPSCPVVHASLGTYPHPHLCGVGLALKLLHALHVSRRGAAPGTLPEELKEHLDLVALGTVADVVPLMGENRYYVKEGLVRLAATGKIGLRELMRVSQAEGRLDTGSVGFRLAPRLNAGGRLENALRPLRLLLTEDADEARAIAEELDALNRRRQEVEGRIFREALELVEAMPELPPALVLTGEEWHEGVIGIVASRLVERYHRPSILLSQRDGIARGSGRSIPAFDLISALHASADLLEQHGGHRQAAGLTLRVENLSSFVDRVISFASQALTEADFVPGFSPDAVARGHDLNLQTADALARLAPFGQGNPPVRLLVLGANLCDPQPTRSGEHLRCRIDVDGVTTRGIGFRLARTIPALEEDSCCHAGLTLKASEWQGFSRAEVELHSLYRPRDLGQASLGCSPDCPFLDGLDQPSPCSHCADPCGEVSRPLPLRGRDLRGTGSLLSEIAQVLSSGEPAAVLCASVTHRLPALASRLPLMELGLPGITCVSRVCWRTRLAGIRPDALLFLDWTAAERRGELLRAKKHLLVVDPPFRSSHTAFLAEAARNGVHLHLAYGQAERAFTEELLKLLLHPRPLMVALFRAWKDGFSGAEAYREVSRRIYEEHRVLPGGEDLRRAEGLLGELGLCPENTAGAKIEVADLPAYAAARAAYEEAVRLCRTL